ncbi:MAG: DUF4277 domain-containing protein [Oligoflexales bacterium]|nr:DUF4277 domain-containing protein [Oligoflexales bacterium]
MIIQVRLFRKKIDIRLPRTDIRRIVSTGESFFAMILNGLGFSNRRLSLLPQFLEEKPVERLIGKNLEAKHFDDHVLGRTSDEIFEYGTTKLFSEVAFKNCLQELFAV